MQPVSVRSYYLGYAESLVTAPERSNAISNAISNVISNTVDQSHEGWSELGVDGKNFGKNSKFFCMGEKPMDSESGGTIEN